MDSLTKGRNRLRATRRVILGFCVLALLVLLAGCDRSIIWLPPTFDVPNCKGLPGVIEPVSVETLNTNAKPRCDLSGIRMVFPDGMEFDAPAYGESSGHQEYDGPSHQQLSDYTWTNLGIYGVVVSSKLGSGPRRWWGSPVGIAKVKYEQG